MKTPFQPASDWAMTQRAAAIVTTSIALVACGGGSSSGGGGNSDSLLKGIVLDGYLVGAKVCLDLNENWVCDTGEPSTMSTTGGRFSLDVAPLKYTDTRTGSVIAEVGPDVVDEASGLTLRAQGMNGYVLATGGGPKPILSAMATLRWAAYLNAGIKDRVEEHVVSNLLKDSFMSFTGEDYFDNAAPLTAAERDLAKRTGRVLTAALSATRERLKAALPTVYGTDPSGLGARAAEMLIQALRATRPASADESESDQRARIIAQVNAIPLVLEQERANRVAASEVPASEAINVLSSGLFDAAALTSSPRGYVRYQLSGNTGSLSTTAAVLRSGAWVPDAAYQRNGAAGYRVLFKDFTQRTMPESMVSIAAPVVRMDGAILREEFSSDIKAPSRRLRLLQRDVGGLPYASVAGLEGIEGTFSRGQKVYQTRREVLVTEEYTFDRVATFIPSLAAFMASPRTCVGGICWSITARAYGNSPESAGTMAFSTTASGGSLDLGEGKFYDEFVSGVHLLRMVSIPIAVQNRSADWSVKEGRYPLFADFDGKLWAGRYTGFGYWYSAPMLSPAAMADVLASANLGVALP
jgi:hypothetical protein